MMLQHALRPHRVLGSLRQPCRAENDGQHVVEVVRQATGQLAKRLKLLRLEQLGAWHPVAWQTHDGR